MKQIRMSNEFTRDLKRIKKRGKLLSKLNILVDLLVLGKKLGVKYREHKLSGNYRGKMECHIEPDWLLIYEVSVDFIILYRTGSHADLFE